MRFGSLVIFVLVAWIRCSDQREEQALPAFVISNLVFNNSPIAITEETYFQVSGSIQFNGAQNGLQSLMLSTALEPEFSVSITGVSQSSGQLLGSFTFKMITTPGTYPFSVWLVDGAGRSSNKLNGSITMIPDPNKPLTPVVLNSVTFDNTTKSALISWTKSTDDNFYAYIVTRHVDNPTSTWNGNKEEVIRIYDRNITSVHDPKNQGTIGFGYSYNVEVSNNNSSVTSNYITLHYPAAIELPDKIGINIWSQPLNSQSHDELYFLDDGSYWGHLSSLKAFSTQSNTIVQSFDFNMFLVFSDFAISNDDSKIYCTLEDSLFVINASDFSLNKTMHLGLFVSSMAYGRDGRLYVNVVSPAPQKGFKVLDAETGAVLGELNRVLEHFIVSEDRHTVYGIGPTFDAYGFPTGITRLTRVNVSSDTPDIVTEKEVGSIFYGLQLSPDQQRLYIGYTNSSTYGNEMIEVLDPESLTHVATSNHPRMNSFIATDTYFLTTNSDSNGAYNFIKRISINDNVLLDSWQLLPASRQEVQITKTGERLYVFGPRSWLINLN